MKGMVYVIMGIILLLNAFIVSSTSVYITPSSPVEGDDLVCHVSTQDYYPPFYFVWQRNGYTFIERWGGNNDYSDTISGSNVKSGETWTCKVYVDTYNTITKIGEASVNVEQKEINHAPSVSLIAPENGADGLDTTVTLKWDGSDVDGDTLSYDVYLGTSKSNMQKKATTGNEQYTVSNLAYATTYYWKIIASDGKTSTESEIWSFTTKHEQIEQPELYVSEDVIDFGTLQKDVQATRHFYIKNAGTGVLEWEAKEDYNWIELSKYSGSLSAEESEYVNVNVYTGQITGCNTGYIDITSNGGNDRIEVRVCVEEPVNHAPEAKNIRVMPEHAKTTSTLICAYEFYDPDGDSEGNSVIRWYKNGIFQKYGDSINPSYTKKGDEWKCSVEPVDSKGLHGAESYSPPKTIENSPPELKKYVPDQVGDEGTSFSLNMREYFYDADVEDGVDTLSYYHSTLEHFTFSISGDVVTFTPDAGWYGSESVTITASDGEDSVRSNTFTLTIRKPEEEKIAPHAYLKSDRNEIYEGESVRFDASRSYDEDGYIVAYKFHFGDGTSTGWVTGPIVDHTYTNKGKYYAYVEVKDNDGLISRSSSITIDVLEKTATEENHNPDIDSIYIKPSTPYDNDDLTCYISVSDVDGNLDSVEIKWIVNGNVVKTIKKEVDGDSEEVRSFLSASYTNAYDTVKCEATVRDDKGAEKTSYSQVSILPVPQQDNRRPYISYMYIKPSNPLPHETLKCYARVEDADGNLKKAVFKWYRNNVLVEKNKKYISGSVENVQDEVYIYKQPGDIITCKLSVYDSQNYYSSKSMSVKVSGSQDQKKHAPVFDSLSIVPDNPYTENDISCLASVSDVDGDLSHIVFYWYVNNIFVKSDTKSVDSYSASTDDVLSNSYTKKGDSVKCVARVYDKSGRWSESSDSVYVNYRIPPQDLNQPPEISIPDQYTTTGSSLILNLHDYADDKEDSDSDLRFFITSQTNTNIAYCSIENGHYIRCDARIQGSSTVSVRVFDTSGLSSDDSFTIHVSSYSPQIEWIKIEPEQPSSNDNIVCTVLTRDEDSNLNYVLFEWFINGAKVRTKAENVYSYSDTASDTLINLYTSPGDNVECKATVVDTDENRDERSASTSIISYPPVAVLSVSKDIANEGEIIYLSAIQSHDSDGYVDKYYFDFGDGTSTGWINNPYAYHSYSSKGTYIARLRVMDNNGKISQWSSVTIKIDGYVQKSGFCGVELKNVEYPSVANGQAKITFVVKNRGSEASKAAVKLYVDGKIMNIISVILSSGEERPGSFSVPLSDGWHDVKLEAYVYCGAYDYRYFAIKSVKTDVEIVVPPEEPAKEEKTDYIKIYPTSIDLESCSGKSIIVEIQSSEKRQFEIRVNGIQNGWVTYPSTVEVKGNKKVYIYVSPHKVGRYEFSVTVSSGNITYTKNIDLYSAPKSVEASAEGAIESMTGMLYMSQKNWLFALSVLFVVILFIAVFYIAQRRRERDYYDEVYKSYY